MRWFLCKRRITPIFLEYYTRFRNSDFKAATQIFTDRFCGPRNPFFRNTPILGVDVYVFNNFLCYATRWFLYKRRITRIFLQYYTCFDNSDFKPTTLNFYWSFPRNKKCPFRGYQNFKESTKLSDTRNLTNPLVSVTKNVETNLLLLETGNTEETERYVSTIPISKRRRKFLPIVSKKQEIPLSGIPKF